MDWGFFRRTRSCHPLPSAQLFPAVVYYLCAILNFLAKLAFLATSAAPAYFGLGTFFVTASEFSVTREVGIGLVAALEVMRRSMCVCTISQYHVSTASSLRCDRWALFRLEFAHADNCENYRAVAVVPSLLLYLVRASSESGSLYRIDFKKSQSCRSRRSQVMAPRPVPVPKQVRWRRLSHIIHDREPR